VCNLHQPHPKGDHSQHHLLQDSPVQICEGAGIENTGLGRRRQLFPLSKPSWAHCHHCVGLLGGDKHQGHLAPALFAGPGTSRLYCVSKDELRAGGHLHESEKLLADLGCGAEDFRQRGLRRRVSTAEGAKRKVPLNWWWQMWKITLNEVFSKMNCFRLILSVRIGLRHTSY
jgi:hypothetical protein